ncbi:hypothetical protein STIAU_6964 [Stigmatella aurantiaca DW4/3-1]|uniref:Uncharacterized protein n=1 Tax=Stigmatella aurantiaca (strain DW4/3-1) TaxID=378806 RepID=Q095R4_STIAD|nr:hypothetical protein STIAU_6964 [Stigmatella aurantiaca DW4/3-1]
MVPASSSARSPLPRDLAHVARHHTCGPKMVTFVCPSTRAASPPCQRVNRPSSAAGSIHRLPRELRAQQVSVPIGQERDGLGLSLAGPRHLHHLSSHQGREIRGLGAADLPHARVGAQQQPLPGRVQGSPRRHAIHPRGRLERPEPRGPAGLARPQVLQHVDVAQRFGGFGDDGQLARARIHDERLGIVMTIRVDERQRFHGEGGIGELRGLGQPEQAHLLPVPEVVPDVRQVDAGGGSLPGRTGPHGDVLEIERGRSRQREGGQHLAPFIDGVEPEAVVRVVVGPEDAWVKRTGRQPGQLWQLRGHGACVLRLAIKDAARHSVRGHVPGGAPCVRRGGRRGQGTRAGTQHAHQQPPRQAAHFRCPDRAVSPGFAHPHPGTGTATSPPTTPSGGRARAGAGWGPPGRSADSGRRGSRCHRSGTRAGCASPARAPPPRRPSPLGSPGPGPRDRSRPLPRGPRETPRAGATTPWADAG